MRCQLVGEDVPQVPMDPPEVMLASLSMTNAEYALWSPGLAYVIPLREELYHDEFNPTCLMPSLTVEDAPASSVPIDPPHLPWTVYAYGPDGFAKEGPVPCNTNVMGYPFLDGTRAPTIQEHEELVWLAGNLKLEVTQYLKDLYSLRGLAYPGNDDNDDDDDGGGGDGDGGEDSEATPSYQPRMRRFL
ncbi:hypothetical protein SO802_012436 [Lithocarpus litseifolius]|uniref:Uncharacterized protein n=1 Tax=Lithocarpus litseifolius TaxID=425828 RepID=A0AAW2D2S2_9ROSI